MKEGKTIDEIWAEVDAMSCEDKVDLYSKALNKAIRWDAESRFEAVSQALGYVEWKFLDGKVYYSKEI